MVGNFCSHHKIKKLFRKALDESLQAVLHLFMKSQNDSTRKNVTNLNGLWRLATEGRNKCFNNAGDDICRRE